MQLIGMIGGLSWESSAEYYRIINRLVQARLGGVHSARCLMYSFDFGEIDALQQRGDWPAAATLMVDAARRLERGGADFLLICSNTMHRMAAEVAAAVSIPLLHIADPTAERTAASASSAPPIPWSRISTAAASRRLVWTSSCRRPTTAASSTR